MTEEYIVRILENDDCITEGVLVRCRDCRHYDKSEDTPYCLRAMWWQDEGDDWFCAGAERKEE